MARLARGLIASGMLLISACSETAGPNGQDLASDAAGDPSPVPSPVPLLASPRAAQDQTEDPVGIEGAWFEDVAESAGIDFVYESGFQGAFLFPEIMMGGAALFDMDGDSDLDIYLVQGGSITAEPEAGPGNQLFRNDGGWRFTDVSAGSGAEDRGYGGGVATGDYDGDGDVDLYVTNVGPNVLLQNQGDGRFVDMTAQAGVAGDAWSASAAFFDMEGDGDLDLFISNYVRWSVEREKPCFASTGEQSYCGPNSYDAPEADVLYRNEGDGRFSDVSAEAGIRASLGNGLGVAPADHDGDGDTDLFVANDMQPDHLWINDGAGGFEDQAPRLGVAVDGDGAAKAGMGTLASDVDEDGDLDILVVNLEGENDSLFLNQGSYYSDETARMGLAGVSRRFTRFGIGLVDFDLDGHLDLYAATGKVRIEGAVPSGGDPFAEPDLLMRGRPEGGFALIEPSGPATSLPRTSRAAAFGDLDSDGRVDILVVDRDAPPRLLRNVAQPSGSWLGLDLRLPSGSPALGARVTVQIGERSLLREVVSAYSYCSANDPRLHVGLGSAQRVDAIDIRWPDGSEERLGPIDELDRYLRIDQAAQGTS